MLGTLILLTRGSLAVFTIFLQPYYSFEFTDLLAATFTGEVEFPCRPFSSCWAPIAGPRLQQQLVRYSLRKYACCARIECGNQLRNVGCPTEASALHLALRTAIATVCVAIAIFAVACQTCACAVLITLHPSTCTLYVKHASCGVVEGVGRHRLDHRLSLDHPNVNGLHHRRTDPILAFCRRRRCSLPTRPEEAVPVGPQTCCAMLAFAAMTRALNAILAPGRSGSSIH